MPSFTQLPPLSLYIHFPWCIQKCPYCDFNSHEQKSPIPEEKYIQTLLNDLEKDLPLIWGRKINTIFMGGGTPSLFSPKSIETLLAGIRARIPVSPSAEITMEANPGTLENERFFGFKEAGINRVSLGIQSFQDRHLKKLGRIHNSSTAIKAIEMVKQAGFNNFNLDLMFALPGQTLEQAVNDIETAIAFSPTHISYYQLTIEPNTAFYKQPPTLPDDDASWDIFETGQKILSQAGFSQYEVSAYSKTNKKCQHNMNYWQFGDYLGIGAGAHAKITDANKQNITRYWKYKHPKDYFNGVEKSYISGSREINGNELIFEFLLNALRLTDGFEPTSFLNHTGLTLSDLQKTLQKPISQKLIHWPEIHSRIETTDRGQRFLNNLLEMCLPG
jgi:oxygen-independent coproporphyrinogen-3 oxidase